MESFSAAIAPKVARTLHAEGLLLDSTINTTDSALRAIPHNPGVTGPIEPVAVGPPAHGGRCAK